jgi:hypothetical protein
MSKLNDIAFLGVCSQVDEAAQPFPYGAVNLFQLSHYKPHFVFPPIIKGDRWVFIIWGEDLTKENLEALEVRVIDEEGNLFTKAKMTLLDDEEDSSKKIEIKGDSTDNNSGLRIGRELNDASEVRRETTICITKENRPVLFSFTTDSLMAKPGKYKVFVKYKGREGELGFVEYVYSPASPLTADKIRAIESNPSAKKIIHYELGCKFCDSKMRIYSAIERDKKLEASGYIYQTEVKDDFHCGCGRTNTPTMYIKESLHGFLYVDYEMLKLDYVRRYAHSNIVNIANIFTSLLDDEHEEERYQKFIESNLVLLAKFYAKSIFLNPLL